MLFVVGKEGSDYQLLKKTFCSLSIWHRTDTNSLITQPLRMGPASLVLMWLIRPK